MLDVYGPEAPQWRVMGRHGHPSGRELILITRNIRAAVAAVVGRHQLAPVLEYRGKTPSRCIAIAKQTLVL